MTNPLPSPTTADADSFSCCDCEILFACDGALDGLIVAADTFSDNAVNAISVVTVIFFVAVMMTIPHKKALCVVGVTHSAKGNIELRYLGLVNQAYMAKKALNRGNVMM
jgi:hypothetical protein